MKISLFLLLFISASCASQSINSIDFLKTEKLMDSDEEASSQFGKNNIKMNLYGILLNSYSFVYERYIANKFSVQAGYRYQSYNYITNTLLGKSLVKRGALDPGLVDFQVGNYAATLDLRYYISKKGYYAKGPFFSVFGRYSHIDLDNIYYTYVTPTDQIYSVPLVSNLTGYGGGISSGIKWVAVKRISIEISTGIQYLSLKGPFESNKDLEGLSESEKIDLKSSLESLFTFYDEQFLNVNVTNNGVSGNFKGPSWTIVFGLALGFTF